MFRWRARASEVPRKNTYLAAVMVLGLVLTLVGGTGIFAVFTDRATQGTNTIDSGARPRAADIQLAVGTPVAGGGFSCGAFEEDLTTPLWTVVDLQPGDSHERYLCAKNNGAAGFMATLSVIDLVNKDSLCTGDESTVDATCGTGTGAGQLASVLEVKVNGYDCGDSSLQGTMGPTGFSAMASTPFSVSPDPLPAGEVGCVGISVAYASSTPEASIQAAQSDGVSWKFAFDVAAVE
jgi:hypothetical protein